MVMGWCLNMDTELIKSTEYFQYWYGDLCDDAHPDERKPHSCKSGKYVLLRRQQFAEQRGSAGIMGAAFGGSIIEMVKRKNRASGWEPLASFFFSGGIAWQR